LGAQAAAAKGAVFLEDALLSGRFGAYAYHRLRFYVARSVVAAGLHVAEVVILSMIFTPRLLGGALLVRISTALVLNGWWGGLEVMRADLRQRRRSGRSHQIARRLGQWLGLAFAAAALAVVGFGGWLAFDLLAADHPFDVFHLYVIAQGVRLVCSLIVRTFHSGVYAVRRIYRPMWSLLIVDVSGFCGVVLLWPWLGAWSFPSLLLAAAVIRSALTLHFTAAAFRSLALRGTPLRVSRPTPGFLRKEVIGRRFFLSGFAYALMAQVDGLLVLALVGGTLAEAPTDELLLLVYIIGPFVRGCFDWAQLYYFDLKRIEPEMFVNFRRALDRSLRTLSVLAAGVCWVLAAVCGTLFLHRSLGALYLVLGVLFLVRSRLACLQIQAFTQNRLGVLLASGLILLGGALACRFVAPAPTQATAHAVAQATAQAAALRIDLFLLCLFAALALVQLWPAADRLTYAEGEVVGPLDWVGRLKVADESLRIRALKLSPRANDSAVAQLAGSLARRLGGTGQVTILGRRRIAWCEFAPAREAGSEEWFWRRGAGLIESLRSSPWEQTGAGALARAVDGGLLGGEVARVDASAPAPPGAPGALAPPGAIIEDRLAVIADRFREMIPTGTMVRLSPALASGPESLPPPLRRDVMQGLVHYSRNWSRPGSGPLDVTALLHQSEVLLIFVVDKSVPGRLRRAWRELINAVNLRLAIGDIDPSAVHILMRTGWQNHSSRRTRQ
jgi:hypothetical protein